MASKFKTMIFRDFKGGRNSRDIPSEIADNQLVELQNFKYDSAGNPVSRGGLTLVKDVGSNITSIFGFTNAQGTNYSLSTIAADIINGSDWATSIKGSITVSNDPWIWRQYNDNVLGVGYTTKLAAWNGTGNVAEIADANCPDNLWLLEIWNERPWVVSRDDGDKLVYAKVGDHTDFTSTGVSGAGNLIIRKGGAITGLIAWKRRFFVFKRSSIFEIIAGDPNTDNTKWNVHELVSGIGCWSPYSVWSIGEDILFLSEYGIASLAATERYGDFASALVSEKIDELYKYSKSTTFYPAIVLPEEPQYWLATKPSATAINTEVHVIDHRESGKYKASKFTGGIVGSCYGIVPDASTGRKRLFVGANNKIYRYGDDAVYSDDGAAYIQKIIFKEMDFGSKGLRKIILHWLLGIRIIAGTSLALKYTYRFDNNPDQEFSETLSISKEESGSLWGSTLPFTFWSADPADIEIKKRLSDEIAGRIGKTFQFEIEISGEGQAILLKELQLEVAAESAQVKISEVA